MPDSGSARPSSLIRGAPGSIVASIGAAGVFVVIANKSSSMSLAMQGFSNISSRPTANQSVGLSMLW
jgi:L-asparaginase II